MVQQSEYSSGVVWHSVFTFSIFWFIGVFTAGLNRMMIPYGYLIRFIAYAWLIYAFINWLCSMNAWRPSDCRIPRFRLSLRGILVAVLLPVLFLFICVGMQSGHWIINIMPREEKVERVFFLLFGTGFCSGIVEEMMFRGYLTKISEQRWGKIKGMIIPTALFVLGHYRAGSASFSFGYRAILIISLSVLLTIVTYQSGQIWDAALIHAFWDIFVARNDVYSVDFAAGSNAFFTYVLDDGLEHPLLKLNEIHIILLASAILWAVIALLLISARLKKQPLLGN